MSADVKPEAGREQRQRRLDEAFHSGELEGAVISDELRADGARYVAGLIDPKEMLARAKARYGIS
ncbi:MAG: antitoxin VbhA family protein [Propionibacteriaceae bacterium]|nr:antitoxin VbhA family protein [Propionibacteriaceae bacterium]